MNPNPNLEKFCAEDLEGTPLLAGIETLAQQTGQTIAELEEHRMVDIVEMAKRHYGDALPEIWKIWIDWNDQDQPQPMGDL